MSTTTYNAHWADSVNVTVNDSTGECAKSSGTGGSFDASARIEQMWEGGFSVLLKATYGVSGNMAIGVLASTYVRGVVTVASFVGCWSIEGTNCVVRESNTSRFSGAVALSDVLEIQLNLSGSTWSLVYKQNGTTRFTSSISSNTIKTWLPFRFVTTHSGSGSKWSAVTVDAESTELFDPDTAGSYAVQPLEDPFDAIEFTPGADVNPLLATREVHAAYGMDCPDCPDPIEVFPARAYVV
jgi:hypothetical protein